MECAVDRLLMSMGLDENSFPEVEEDSIHNKEEKIMDNKKIDVLGYDVESCRVVKVAVVDKSSKMTKTFYKKVERLPEYVVIDVVGSDGKIYHKVGKINRDYVAVRDDKGYVNPVKRTDVVDGIKATDMRTNYTKCMPLPSGAHFDKEDLEKMFRRVAATYTKKK